MKWLIDLIIEAIGIPPVYVDRGDFADADFDINDLTLDNAWHELDLSAIVPENTSAVVLRVRCKSTDINEKIRFRKHGVTAEQHTCQVRTQVSTIDMIAMPVIGVSSDRKIEYQSAAGTWLAIWFNVRGWFLGGE